VEEIEVPSLRAAVDDAEVRATNATARYDAAEVQTAAVDQEMQRVIAERDRRLAATSADFQRALDERDRRVNECELRRAAEAAESERRLRTRETAWEEAGLALVSPRTFAVSKHIQLMTASTSSLWSMYNQSDTRECQP
jgi:hypothetical protein